MIAPVELHRRKGMAAMAQFSGKLQTWKIEPFPGLEQEELSFFKLQLEVQWVG